MHVFLYLHKKECRKDKSESNELGYIGGGGKGLEREQSVDGVRSGMGEGYFSKDAFL